jgi:acyl dehydratase
MSNLPIPLRTPADLTALLGQEVGPSKPFLVSRERVTEFATVTGDPQEIHLSDDAAQEAGFPTAIAHGYFVMSLIAHWGPQLIRWPAPVINYGADRLRFLSPVLVGDELQASVTLTGSRDKGEMIIVEATYTVSTVAGGVVVMVADTLIATTGWEKP